MIKKPHIFPISTALAVGFLISIGVFSATAKTVSAPSNDIWILAHTAFPPTIFQSAFLALHPPQTPTNGYLTLEEHFLVVTGYSSTPDQTNEDPFITAQGTDVRWGVVAANFLPFGTKIRIPKFFGDEIFMVEDRMNKRYPYRIDVWFHSRENALTFGINNAKIEIVKEF